MALRRGFVDDAGTRNSGPDRGPLEARAGGLPWLLGRMVLSAWPLLIFVTLRDDPGTLWPRRVFGGLLILMIFVAAAGYLRRRAQGCLVRLDDAGITVPGGRTVGWDEISEVRVTRKGMTDGMAFIPRSGVADLPMPPMTLFVLRPERLAARMIKVWGSPLVLMPGMLDVSRTRIIDAVRRFSGGVPVLDPHREIVVS